MNAKILGILVVLAALAVGGVLLTGGEEPEGQVITQQYLVPGLEEHLNAVERLRLTRAGDELVTELARTDDGWVVVNRDNYPANLSQVRETLLGLADSRLVEEKTSNPEFYERLGVNDMDQADAGGTGLELLGLEASPVSLIIGDPADSAAGTYARRAGEARSWLASGTLGLSQSISDWLDTAVVDIPAAQIQSISIQHPDGEILRLEKASRDQTDFSVVEIPEGRELSSPGSANALGGVLAGLQLEDVLAATELEASDPVSVQYQSFDGLVLEAQVLQRDELAYLRFTDSRYDEALARRFVEAPVADSADGADAAVSDEAASEAPAASGESAPGLSEEAIAEGQQRATELTARLLGWAFQIPAYKHDNMTRRLADLLAPVEEAAPPGDGADDLVPILPDPS